MAGGGRQGDTELTDRVEVIGFYKPVYYLLLHVVTIPTQQSEPYCDTVTCRHLVYCSNNKAIRALIY
jgi:hypothetical protein